MSPRGPRNRRFPSNWRILIVDACRESRHALLEGLLAEGYRLIATNSVPAACALGQTPEVKLVIVNLSTFTAAGLRELGQALRQRRCLRILAMLSHVSMASRQRHASYFLRFSGSKALAVGLESRCPN